MPPSGPIGPAYDEADFEANIARLALNVTPFYQSRMDGEPCQGDVIELDAPRVFLDADGRARKSDNSHRYWLIAGNTCDLDRVELTSLLPVRSGPGPGGEPPPVRDLQSYRLARQFLLPRWAEHLPEATYFVDFTEAVTIMRVGVNGRVRARMTDRAWMLFHNCTIRFWARKDGRHVK